MKRIPLPGGGERYEPETDEERRTLVRLAMTPIPPPAPRMSPAERREAAARAIYEKRPFYMASTKHPMEGMQVDRKFDWDSAPAGYQMDCYELADAVLAAIDG